MSVVGVAVERSLVGPIVMGERVKAVGIPVGTLLSFEDGVLVGALLRTCGVSVGTLVSGSDGGALVGALLEDVAGVLLGFGVG